MTTLRDYQSNLIYRIEKEISRGKKKIMLQLPTGAGKTVCFVELAKRHRDKKYLAEPNCLIISHRKELVEQAVASLSKDGIYRQEIGIIRANEVAHPNRTIQVASIQSLIRRDFPKAGLVIIDEVHHAPAETYRKIIEHYKNSIILGVTATPIRIDGKGFRHIFDVLIQGPSVSDLTLKKYLCPYKLYAYNQPRIDTESIRTFRNGDYSIDQLVNIVTKSEVKADLVKTWKTHALGKRTLVFAVDVELSKQYAQLYNDAGYKAEHLDGKTPQDQREKILARFKAGKTLIICNCGVLTEGVDVPQMECVQIVRPTQSLVLWLQMVGRVLRTYQGKEYAIILDHTDNHQRLGFPDSPRAWTLNGISELNSLLTFSEDNKQDNRTHLQRIHDLFHSDGELSEVHSNYQIPNLQARDEVTKLNAPNTSQKQSTTKLIKINKTTWTVDSNLADVISQKLIKLSNLELKILRENTGRNQNNKRKNNNNQEYLDKTHECYFADNQEQLDLFEIKVSNLKIQLQNVNTQIEAKTKQFTSVQEELILAQEKLNLLDLDLDLRKKTELTKNTKSELQLSKLQKQLEENTKNLENRIHQVNNLRSEISSLQQQLSKFTNDNSYSKGLELEELGDYQGAINSYNQAIKFNADHAFAHKRLGLLLLIMDNEKDSLSHLKKAALLFKRQGNQDLSQVCLHKIQTIQTK